MIDLREALSVYFIMGSTNCVKNPADVLNEAISGGITLFQFREKGEGALTGTEKYCTGSKTPNHLSRTSDSIHG